MIDAEEARTRLDAIGDGDWRAKAGKRARKLHRRLRPLAAGLLAPDPVLTDQKAVRQHWERCAVLAGQLDDLSEIDRVELMAALHPTLGRPLARWWVDAVGQPYTIGWTRKAFRSPRTPTLTREHRIRSLLGILAAVGPYARDATWLAAWAPHVASGRHVGPAAGMFCHMDAGPLLAAAIDEGGSEGQAVIDTLTAIGSSEHPVGIMGRHVIVGLLRASRPDGWAFMERLLLAAQRQEGLRQSILEAADEGHPQAFDRMMAVTLEHDLLRFAATVRAVGVWIGFQADVEHIPEARRRLEQLRRYRNDDAARRAAVEGGDGWETYTALCALAMTDAMGALTAAQEIVAAPAPATRPADARAGAVRFVEAAQLPAGEALAWGALDDDDLRVAWLAFAIVRRMQSDGPPDAFHRLERFAHRLSEKDRSLDPIGIEVAAITVSRAPVVTHMLLHRGRRPLSDLLPWVPAMDPWTRYHLAGEIADAGHRLTPGLRDTVLVMVGDRSPLVRGAAVEAMSKLRVLPTDAPPLEALLTRKAGDLRRGIIGLLASMPEQDVVRSAGRLWEGDAAQRDAACELLREVKDRPSALAAAVRFADASPSPRQAELLADITGTSAAPSYAADPGLGLYDPRRRAPIPSPSAPARRPSFVSSTALGIVGALDDVAEAHRDTLLTVGSWQGSQEVLLADARWLPSPFQHRYLYRQIEGQPDEQGAGLILPDVFRPWWENRPSALRDATDDLDALRAVTALAVSRPGGYVSPYHRHQQNGWWSALMERLGSGRTGEIRHPAVVTHVLSWLLAETVTVAAVDECLDALAATAAGVPASAVRALETGADRNDRRWDADFRHLLSGHPWLSVMLGLYGRRPDLFGPDQIRRWFHLARWFDEPKPGTDRNLVDSKVAMRAFELGVATEHDLFDLFLQRGSHLLAPMTRHRYTEVAARHPEVAALADRMRVRILDIELVRGELATPASAVAFQVGSISGAAVVARLLSGLGRATLVRGYLGHNEGREAVYSHLLRVSHPGPDDTGDTLRAAATAAGVSDQRLLELAVFAPQWATLIEDALGWEGLADGVWWFHAHTKDDQWAVDNEVRETWAALSAERTPLTGDDLVAGAVDVAWFHRSRAALGDARWKKLHAVAKLASGGSGHRRAQLFAEAMSGMTGEDSLVERIRTKRHQDSVRALGLVPLPDPASVDGPSKREAALLGRYGVIREFERGSSQFGSQRQASEKLAARIGVENLARSAGLVDPQRFVWAMEAAEAGDLADGPVTVTDDDLSVTLAVDGEGVPFIGVQRNGRTIKAVPPKSKKLPAIADLLARKTALTRQARRVRASLETAMVNQDGFTTGDLSALDRHPVVAPMLALVVFADEDGKLVRRAVEGRFVDVSGALTSPTGVLRLAHPVDLTASGEWLAWQEQLFVDEERQPFRQVFRELYTLTEAEKAGGPGSHRYEGHQVQPRQALALLGRRGWLADRESGEVARVFHSHGIAARLQFVDGFGTPAEVELPTVEGVYFTRKGTWLAENIETVPPVVFSEAMRDVDLVVSVAHVGGVDPEASHSTVEMRAALVRETARVLKLDNVREVSSHVVIEGVLGEYSVHLGSGVVHRRPGGAVCIVPVDSQRRGRIFLPFADDDPKTAEVVAKVLLLARDREIKDPTILSQLRSDL